MKRQVIVVEGTHDAQRINSIYEDVTVVTTNGSQISDDTIKLIQKLSLNHEIICLLDPDYPGERIRSIITNYVPNAKHAFIKKEKCISRNKKKVGIEHANKIDIIEALDSILEKQEKTELITLADLYNLNIVCNKELRKNVSDRLNIGNPNVKTFLKRINMIDIDKLSLEVLVNECK